MEQNILCGSLSDLDTGSSVTVEVLREYLRWYMRIFFHDNTNYLIVILQYCLGAEEIMLVFYCLHGLLLFTAGFIFIFDTSALEIM